jgi:DNA-binding response OmpR family regulator
LKNHKKLKEIPVIALSGRTEIRRKFYIEKGFETNIIKPFDASELLLKIAKILKLDYIEKEIIPKEKEKTVAAEEQIPFLYDLSDLKIFTDGDQESLALLLKTFIENSALNLKKLEEAKQNKDRQQIAFTAHKMLPMFRQIKATSVTESLEKLEKQHALKLTFEQIEGFVLETLKIVKLVLTELKKEV